VHRRKHPSTGKGLQNGLQNVLQPVWEAGELLQGFPLSLFALFIYWKEDKKEKMDWFFFLLNDTT